MDPRAGRAPLSPKPPNAPLCFWLCWWYEILERQNYGVAKREAPSKAPAAQSACRQFCCVTGKRVRPLCRFGTDGPFLARGYLQFALAFDRDLPRQSFSTSSPKEMFAPLLRTSAAVSVPKKIAAPPVDPFPRSILAGSREPKILEHIL